MSQLKKWAKIGLAVYVGTAGAAYVFFKPKAGKPAAVAADPSRPISEEDRRRIFDLNASHYDADIDKSEKWAGIASLREKLCGEIPGGASVLEVGAGTCRNLSCYPAGTRLVAMDFAASMLELGKKRAKELKWQEVGEAGTLLSSGQSTSPERKVAFLVHNQTTGIPFADGSLDVVVDTFGLCSYEDPVSVLKEMARVSRGKVLLLEHGKSSWQWLSKLLDDNTPGHVAKHGCYWNRPIDELVKAAGLKIERMERKHGGTTYLLVCSGGGANATSSSSSPSAASSARPQLA